MENIADGKLEHEQTFVVPLRFQSFLRGFVNCSTSILGNSDVRVAKWFMNKKNFMYEIMYVKR